MRDTIDMAREAGFQTGKRDYADGNGAYPFVVSAATGNFLVELKAFEALVRADEREACAKLCDDYDVKYDVCSSDTAESIAQQIRARGNT